MSNVSITTIDQLNTATSAIVIIISLINFVMGLVGLILNVYIFTRRNLCREACSLYFLSSTCFNLFIVLIVIPVRIISSGFNIDLANFNIVICKLEVFSFYTTRTISCWLIVLACVDRYLHSSSNERIRRLSSLKIARINILIMIIALIILYSHMIIYYEIGNVSDSNGNIVPECHGQKGFYRTFIAIWNMTLYSLCPSFLMILFGLFTLNNVHRRRQILPIVNENNRMNRRTDLQLLRMLSLQVFVIIISTLPFSIYRLYASFTASVVKDALRVAQENFLAQTVNTMAFFAHTTSFYLYTLTGTVFRKEFIKIINHFWSHNRNIVHGP